MHLKTPNMIISWREKQLINVQQTTTKGSEVCSPWKLKIFGSYDVAFSGF